MKVQPILILGAVFLIGLAAVAAVMSSRLDTAATDKLAVAASIFPVADIVRQVGGDTVDVHVLIPPGVSEHSFELTPRQVAELQEAKVIFVVGHGLEDQVVERLRGALPQTSLVTVDRGIAVREFGEEEEHGADEEEHAHDVGTDPHYWLTVPNAALIAATVADALSELDPANAAAYRQNLEQYQQQLDELEQELQAMARGISRKEFIAMHNAWSYFADHYGLELAATYEPVEGRESTVSDLEHLREVVEQHGITTFFAEPQKATSSAVSFIQREFGLKILLLDPVGGTDETSSYVDLMRFNMNSIVEGAR
jgi:ABC-type Zn uptake system ZnuABC Zn-binding protein ZnuA